MSFDRVFVDGRCFRCGGEPFFVKGFTYGPFCPQVDGVCLPPREQVKRDLAQIRDLHGNVLRVYHVPPKWFLDDVMAAGLRLLVDVPWGKHLCFLYDRLARAQAREIIRSAAEVCKGHPAVFALSVVNEFSSDLVRFSDGERRGLLGRRSVSGFVKELIAEVKEVDPGMLCTFSNYPTTEYFEVPSVDFHSFNVYLHDREEFANYLSRLANLTDGKPLLLAEMGVDSIRNGENFQAEVVKGKLETVRSAGLGGAILFSYTDEWFTGGHQIEDWAFGMVDRQRKPKAVYSVVQQIFKQDFVPQEEKFPRVSVIVASYNGAGTLDACLESLKTVRYPDYEVILVDDGSSDNTGEIAARYSWVKYIRHPKNKGLSVARNTGLDAATGEIVVYTDADCRVSEYWLTYLVDRLLHSDCVGVGGPNYLPPEDSSIARAVMASPGGPAAVLIDDREAEHIPGCNMGFWKWALKEIGGFDAQFMRAGDDVDVCWRFQQRGWRLGWHPMAFVWHYRRGTVKAYIKQQMGYGEAESLLRRKHPAYFNMLGACMWKGRIYANESSLPTLGRKRIYHGIFGSALFQTLYSPSPVPGLLMLTSLEYHLIVTLPLMLLAVFFPTFLPLMLVSLAASLGTCILAAFEQRLTRPRWWSRGLVCLLFFLQPLVRSYARYQVLLKEPVPSLEKMEDLQAASLDKISVRRHKMAFWIMRDNAGMRCDRVLMLGQLGTYLRGKQVILREDSGWDEYDLLVHGGFWTRLEVLTMCEPHSEGNSLFRLALKTRWSSAGRVIFGLSAFVVLLLVGLLSPVTAWAWVLVLTLLIQPVRCHRQRGMLMRCVTSEIRNFFVKEIKATPVKE